ncbi:hypothetical protein [Roseimaritima ulvae]|uniref:Uncharacterized protein n=1 Tax=Roseimaritima ulvae TaxID=980254 RepID=A0A5B9QN32_9BACT|nr:hypothetical protein [Roseimaritima ulvae]QEG39040.1 hypothetical protein UC8_10010 [Roseimaritima ulvae]
MLLSQASPEAQPRAAADVGNHGRHTSPIRFGPHGPVDNAGACGAW